MRKLCVIRVYDLRRSPGESAHRCAESGSEGARTLDERRSRSKIHRLGWAERCPDRARCIRGNTGYAALDFIQSIDASLLALRSIPRPAAMVCRRTPPGSRT
jgi:hypothetical protein